MRQPGPVGLGSLRLRGRRKRHKCLKGASALWHVRRPAKLHKVSTRYPYRRPCTKWRAHSDPVGGGTGFLSRTNLTLSTVRLGRREALALPSVMADFCLLSRKIPGPRIQKQLAGIHLVIKRVNTVLVSQVSVEWNTVFLWLRDPYQI